MMKSHIWIFLLISISTFIDATSNESTSAAVKFILSPSILTREISTNSGGILIRKNSSQANMSSVLPITTPQSISQHTATTARYFGNVHDMELRRYNSTKLHLTMKAKRSTDDEDLCEKFVFNEEHEKSFYSPGYPSTYVKNITCTRVLQAKVGYLLRLDFRDHFHIEPSEGCQFDSLEIRDGGHGFSPLIGKYCGTNFPDEITSKDRELWLRFKSDENIEYAGFQIVYDSIPRPPSDVYDDIPCSLNYTGEYEGWVNSTFIDAEKIEFVKKHKLQLDCLFKIEVEVGWQISLKFEHFKLDYPNDCENNLVQVFDKETDESNMLKKFCGSIADAASSKSNIVYIRLFADVKAIDAAFSVLYTAYQDKKDLKDKQCDKNEHFDCEDNMCIKQSLRCDEKENCRFKSDEDVEMCAKEKDKEASHEIIIISIVFGAMLTVLVIAFMVNCMRKLMRDHKIIREHIRQSRESKLDELGRHSTKLTKSRENIALQQLTKIPPPSFDLDSPNSINLIENTTNHGYYRDNGNNGARIDSKNDLNLREQEIKNILGSSYHQHDDSSFDQKDGGEMCDTACQTRESLFQPVFKNKVTQSPMPSGLRFSTFGYLDSSTPSPPPPPNIMTLPGGHCPTHSQSKGNTMPHQHSHHHHYHHIHSSTNQSSLDGIDKGTGTMESDEKQKKFMVKKDDPQARSYNDVRKSAPDVIIIAGCNTSH